MSTDTTAVIDTTPAADTTAAIPSRTVYVTADPDRPPYDYIGRHRCHDEVQAAPRPARRGRKLLAGALALVGISVTIACSGAATPDAPPLDDSPAATHAAAPKGKPPAGYGDGQHKTGADIAAGTYTTTVPADAFDCYWARLKNFDGELNSVIANGNLAPGAKGRIVVKKTDAGVEFTGGCVWAKAAK